MGVFLLGARTAIAEPFHADSSGKAKQVHPTAPAGETGAQKGLLERVAELEAQLKELQKSAAKGPTLSNVTDLNRSRKMSEVGIAHNCVACDDRYFTLGTPKLFTVNNNEGACEAALSQCTYDRGHDARSHCYVYNPAIPGSCGPRSHNSDGRVIENRYECRYRIPGRFSLGRLANGATGLTREEADERALRNCQSERSVTSAACHREYCRPYVEAVER